MSVSEICDKTEHIKSLLLQQGFADVACARIRPLNEYSNSLVDWLEKGYQAEMSFMEKHFDKRVDPEVLVPGAKSLVLVILNYYPANRQPDDIPQVAKYAYGRDYHKVVKKKLSRVLNILTKDYGINGRAFVDSAPVMEKPWGELSGIGWIGKNGCLISPRHGSFFVIGELIVDCELNYDKPAVMACGACSRCIDACPTNAIVSDGVVDSQKCISYLTIEKKSMEVTEVDSLHNRVFGCDICQDVCPWNKKSKPTLEPDFEPRNGILEMSAQKWKLLSEAEFKKTFAGSPIYRAGHSGIQRSLTKNSDNSFEE